ncbi:HTH domain-containing protein [Ochrobactrum sp. MYb379]|uniref:HTH domain-containing protein n=1 Tax=Ochrobactrum sp. MYb379 TaxID=2745275 RepID=UPI00309E1512
MRAKTAMFYLYSSRNKKGGKPHPVVFRRKDRVLTMWWEHRTAAEIAEELDISIDTVRGYIKTARKAGDPRATRTRATKRIMAAQTRRRNIVELNSRGLDVKEIAKALSVHPRLVQMRLKEALCV